MSWFCEEPNPLTDATGPQAIGRKGKTARLQSQPRDIFAADLSRTGTAAAAAKTTGKGVNASWSRFMEQIFTAFREKREPFWRPGASGKRDEDRDDDESDDDGDDQADGNPKADVGDSAIERSLVSL